VQRVTRGPCTVVVVFVVVVVVVVLSHLVRCSFPCFQGDKDAKVFRYPYSDWSGFKPVNTAYDLIDIRKWQPLLETDNHGYFTVQQHVTPYAGRLSPLLASRSYFHNTRSPAPYPVSKLWVRNVDSLRSC